MLLELGIFMIITMFALVALALLARIFKILAI